MDMLDELVTHNIKLELMSDLRNCYEYDFIVKTKEEDLCFSWECYPFKYKYPIAIGKVTMDGEVINMDIFNNHPLFKDKDDNILRVSIDHFKEQLVNWFLKIVNDIE